MSGAVDAPGAAAGPSYDEAVRTWARIGLLSFGGPAAQIALMHRVVVSEKGWLGERAFANALGFCMLLPGPEAMQLAAYVGWRLHGVAGGLAAGLLFIGPGAVIVLALAALYAAFGQAPAIDAAFLGVKAAVIGIVIEAILRIGRRALTGPAHWAIAALSFVAIFFFDLPFPAIIAAAALWGAMMSGPEVDDPSTASAAMGASHRGAALRAALIFGAAWLGPLLLLEAAFGGDDGPLGVLPQIGWFFSKLAVVTFGGAYSVLAYMAQDVVDAFGWLTPGQMIDGLGLAETTPGPLILVTEFVGFLAGYNVSAGGWTIALLGALIALWATFAPCFLWIFAGAPFVDRLNASRRLRGALSGVTAAVVGVVANLSLWFALHTLFGEVEEVSAGWARLWTPRLETLDPLALGLALLCAFLLFGLKQKIIPVLGLAVACGLVLQFLAGF